MRICLVETFLADRLKFKTTHHRVEKDLEEIQMIFVCFFHDLDPLDGDLVGCAFVFSLEDWQLADLLQREDTKAVVNVKFEVLLDFVAALFEDLFAIRTRIVRNLRLKLDRVLVHSLHGGVVKVNGEVVRVEFHWAALGTLGAVGFGGEKACAFGLCGYHSCNPLFVVSVLLCFVSLGVERCLSRNCNYSQKLAA